MNSVIKTGVVPEFRGEYRFLSNYYTAPFEWRGVEFQSGEQAFAYAKTFCAMTSLAATNGGDQILAAKTPGDAKKLGRKLEISVKDWDGMKVQYMREIVHAKFAGVRGLAGSLINTGAMILVEGNNWNDHFWGRCKNEEGRWVGYNTLGTILMEERGFLLHHVVSCPNCKHVL